MVYDVIVVGAGHSGISMLLQLRAAGFNTRVVDARSEVGGRWAVNRYPGSRTHCPQPFPQFIEEEPYSLFEWNEVYSDSKSLREYYNYIYKTLDLSRDVVLNTKVISASFDNHYKRWFIETTDGYPIWGISQHLILCTGLHSKKYVPAIKGLESFKGELFHSSEWPMAGIELDGKSVAVIGTGAAGVQLIQELAQIVPELTVYQRTPAMALPMRKVTDEEGNQQKKNWSREEAKKSFEQAKTTFSGTSFDFVHRNTFDDTAEERERFYEGLWVEGGPAFWLGTYQDVLKDPLANETAYNFWRDKTRARINDDTKKELLVPMKPPHPFGAKQPVLESNYYEAFNQSNINIVNLRESPLIKITESGIVTEKEGLIEFEVIIMATGFDSITAGISDIVIKNSEVNGSLCSKWYADGTSTYLGISCAGFHNLFFINGPHSPIGFANEAVVANIQCKWVKELLETMRRDKLQTVVAMKEGEEKWTNRIRTMWNSSLFASTESWMEGGNIPGKRREGLLYMEGIPNYVRILNNYTNGNYEGFKLTSYAIVRETAQRDEEKEKAKKIPSKRSRVVAKCCVM